MKKLFLILLFSFTFISLNAKDELIQSGPMLGYSDYREVLIWIQLKGKADVLAKYYDINDKSKIYSTDIKTTVKDNAFIAKMIADAVLPGKKYKYEIYINGKKSDFDYNLEFQTPINWKWKIDPPDFSFALGSCFYVNDEPWDRKGKPYGGEYFIMNSILEKKPDFMLWMGDNVYLREGDWNSKTGIYYRWTHSRSIPELQPLLASVHHYGIWDDHDYGPNDANRSFSYKELTKNAFQDFFGNPESYLPSNTFSFEWGDCEFFMMDNRWFKEANQDTTKDKSYYGQLQLNWLTDNLVDSKAKFKFVVTGGQILNPLKVNENFANYESEREQLLNLINEYNIKGVVFLTGDVHFSEISKLEMNNGTKCYDFTSSTLTAGPYTDGCNQQNPLRVEGKCYNKRNFGTINIFTENGKRKLKLITFDNTGNEVWNYIISEEDF